MKRIRGAGCVVTVRVTGPTDRRAESVTAERETAPVDTFQAGQILSVIARETYTVSKLPKQRCRLTASLAQSEGRSAISSARLCGVWGSLQRSLFSSEANKMWSVSTHKIIVR